MTTQSTTGPITAATRKRLIAIMRKLGIFDDRASIIHSFTNGRAQGITTIGEGDARALCSHLLSSRPAATEPKSQWVPGGHVPEHVRKSWSRMRAKVIALLASPPMNWTASHMPDHKPDYSRIDRYIQGIGSNNPEKKKLSYLTYDEMLAVLKQVEQMVIKHRPRI